MIRIEFSPLRPARCSACHVAIQSVLATFLLSGDAQAKNDSLPISNFLGKSMRSRVIVIALSIQQQTLRFVSVKAC